MTIDPVGKGFWRKALSELRNIFVASPTPRIAPQYRRFDGTEKLIQRCEPSVTGCLGIIMW